MNSKISHDWNEETIEAKTLWFRSLSLSERMDVFCAYTDIAIELNPNFRTKSMLNRLKDVFKSFQQYDVRYVVIGGIAAVLYGVPRATFNMDILIEAARENAQRLLDALINAGIGTATLIDSDEILPNEITIFKDRIRIDVQISTPGLQFEKAWNTRKTMKYQGQEFHVVSIKDLIRSKRAAGRDVDLEDIRLLELPNNDNAT